MRSKSIFLSVLGIFLLSCNLLSTGLKPPATEEPETIQPSAVPATPPPAPASTADKWSLWTSGTQLRGANTWQRIMVPELDGNEFLGNGYIGPPYTQGDFDKLAAQNRARPDGVKISRSGMPAR